MQSLNKRYLRDRTAYEKIETEVLAPYAQKSAETKGRRHQEEKHRFRSPYQRDRDRIVHCRAFRRLEYKTQVFVNHEGDHYRTRLTHTMEVATIGRSIARTLKLNEDLVEAIALAHDVGHAAFGHSGESILNELMKDHGGFEHNHQSLRIVDELEKKYPHFDGLNLTWEVREGIIKHTSSYDSPPESGLDPNRSPLLETQVVNVADEIAYNSHDLDDGLASAFISEEELRDVAVWDRAYRDVTKRFPRINEEVRRYYTIRSLIDDQVRDVLEMTEKNLGKFSVLSTNDVKKICEPIITFSPKQADLNSVLKQYLYENLYGHYRVAIMNQKAARIITELFQVYANNPKLLAPSTQVKLHKDSLPRVICDYIAGMTDRYAIKEYQRLCDLSDKI